MVPLFQVAVGARIDGGLRVRLHGAGKHEILGRRFSDWVNYRDRRNGQLLRFFGQRLVLRFPLNQREHANYDQHDYDNHERQKKQAALLGRPFLSFRFHQAPPSVGAILTNKPQNWC